MDWVEEAPERELPERDDDKELGLTSFALGASASSLWWGKQRTARVRLFTHSSGAILVLIQLLNEDKIKSVFKHLLFQWDKV